MEQLDSQKTDMHEILFLGVFQKPVKNVKVLLKPDKNNRYFT
jgi:hypothetical protein